MKKHLVAMALLVSSVSGARSLLAQDLIITNARVVVGNGTVINQGSIVVRGGRIVSVAAGAPG